MRAIFRQIIIGFIFFVGAGISLVAADTEKSFRLSFPQEFWFSENEARRTRIDVSFGAKADYFMFSRGSFSFGPGVALSCSVPTGHGNNTVSIRPYYLLGEIRFLSNIDLFDDKQGFSPHLAIAAQSGSLFIAKWVNDVRRVDASFIFGSAVYAGITYWFNGVGAGLSYGLSLTNVSLRHKIELAFELKIPS